MIRYVDTVRNYEFHAKTQRTAILNTKTLPNLLFGGISVHTLRFYVLNKLAPKDGHGNGRRTVWTVFLDGPDVPGSVSGGRSLESSGGSES